jgi:hypothetical protein
MRNIAALLLLFFCACKTGKNYLPVNSGEDISRNLTPQEQLFTIDANKDNLVKGEKGTQLFIPAGALVFEDGSAVKGGAVILLKEFYSSGDMMSANLSSMSDSFMLQTGGMLYMEAKADGKKLQVDGRKSIVISFPRKKGINSMEVFYGRTPVNGAVNWMPGVEQNYGSEAVDTLLTKDSSLYTEQMRVCSWLASTSNYDIKWILKDKDSNVWNYVERHLMLAPELRNEFRRDIAGDIGDIGLMLDRKGKVTAVSFYQGSYFDKKPSSLSSKARAAITTFFKNMPPFDMKQMSPEREEHHLAICCEKRIDRDKYAAAFKAKYDKYRDEAVKAMDASEAELYILNATQLGWINCDRFYEYSGEKTDFVVEVPNVKEPKVQLIFPDINSVMQGTVQNGKAVFSNVPVGKSVTVTAIAFGGKEQPLMAKAAAVTGK